MSYSNSRFITIDNTKVSGSSNLTNFPVLISSDYIDNDLYNEGTGEDDWVVGYNRGITTESKNADHLYLYGSAANATDTTYVTDVAQDLTDVVRIDVEWDTNGTSPYAILLTAGTDKTGRARLDKFKLRHGRDEFTRRTESLDVSSLTGNFYIKCAIESAGFDGGGISKGRFYRVTLVTVDNEIIDLRTTANGGDIENTEGIGNGRMIVPADLAFFSDSNLTTQIDHEIEKYSPLTGELKAWVEVPTLKYNQDTIIYMGYGDSSVTTSQEDVTGTWNSNYEAVWHMEHEGSLRLDGVDDFVSIPSSSIPSGSYFTCSFWHYGFSGELTTSDSIILAENSSSNRVLNIHFPWGNGNIYFDAGNSTGYDRIYKSVSSADYTGWNYWSFVKDSNAGTMKIYRNGSLWHSGTGLTRTMDTTSNVKLGSNATGTGLYHKGLIRHFRTYSTALSQSDIQDIYKSEEKAPSTGLVAYWPFRDDFYDYSGNEYDGSNNGGEIDASLPESTSNNYQMSDNVPEVFAKIGKGQSFDGAAGSRVGSQFNLNLHNQHTLSFWIKRTDVTDWSATRAASDKFNTYNSGKVSLEQRNGGLFRARYGAGGTDATAGNVYPSLNTWHHYVWFHGAYNQDGGYWGHDHATYWDGSLNASGRWEGYRYNTKPDPPDYDPEKNDTSVFDMGRASSVFHSYDLDELRILSTELSSDWVATEYNNQNSPNTFYTIEEGSIMVWTGSEWIKKPIKWFNGSEWVVKPLKRYNGSEWELM